jgi:hypothetical protein
VGYLSRLLSFALHTLALVQSKTQTLTEYGDFMDLPGWSVSSEVQLFFTITIVLVGNYCFFPNGSFFYADDCCDRCQRDMACGRVSNATKARK